MDIGVLISEYFSPIILLACLCIGYVIKAVFKSEQVNRFIPLIVLILGVIFNVWFEWDISLPIIVAGMVSGLASTGLYELVDTTILNVSRFCKPYIITTSSTKKDDEE